MMNAAYHEQWVTEGYLVVRGVYGPERVETLRTICETVLTQWRVCNPENGKPGGGPDATCMRHLNHPGYFADHPEWQRSMLEAVADEGVLDIARTIFGEEPLFRCTSLFFNPLDQSRDGNWHRDVQFWAKDETEERRFVEEEGIAGGGVQMQIALVPSADVEFVPQSHIRWDTPEEYHIRKADGEAHNRANTMPGALRIALEPGDAALFNPVGLHRGRYHVDKLRRTLMLTYTKTSQPCYDYFSHQPWFMQPGYLDGLAPQFRVFFDQFVEMYTRRWQEKG